MIGATVPLSIRLSLADLKALDALASRFNTQRPGAIALAIRHMAATLDQGQPVYVTRPGAGMASLNTPSAAMARVLDGNKARVMSRLRSKEQALKSKR